MDNMSALEQALDILPMMIPIYSRLSRSHEDLKTIASKVLLLFLV